MRKNILLCGITFVVLTFIGCKEDAVLSVDNQGEIKYLDLVFNADYIDSEEVNIRKTASKQFSSYSGVKDAHVTRLSNAFFSEVSVVEKTRSYTPKSQALLSKANKVATASKEGVNYPVSTDNLKIRSLADSVKFMVLIFDDKDNHVGTTIASRGAQTRIPLLVPVDYVPTVANKYRIVAFTFNTTEASDFDYLNLDPSETNNNPQIVLPSDREFYYHNNDLPIVETGASNPAKVNIIFLPQTVKVGVTVDARGVDAKIKEVSGTFGSFPNAQSANFDLKLNRVINKVVIPEQNFPTAFSFTGTADTVSFARYIYMDESDETIFLERLNLTLETLVLQKNGETTNVSILGESKSYSFSGVSLKKGTYFNGRINLFSGFDIDGVIWSYANLYYDKNAPVGYQHKFRQSPSDGYKELTDYWNFNKEFPKSEDESGRDIDPCTLVYPGGWRMPTIAEASLANPSNINLKSFSYFDASGSSVERDYDYMELINNEDQKIHFYAFGMRDGLVYSGEGANALYWLAGSSLSTQADVFRIGILETGNDSGSGLIDYPDYVTSGARGLNIRCVRTLRN
ncbi:hypothetical protein [Sphingobacterium bovistauri]|uniref:Uncharacterized protein n=1 Tax=Sphingobacterium bovistauri TaxID=2781959 RepID=A0ABS7Z243_9SPHI|nr:hypothetical protein [Sphingobacterium bovistauri]MCA5004237.1 hypothetical protein [Sphingobacterium bovistauri]